MMTKSENLDHLNVLRKIDKMQDLRKGLLLAWF